jgi:hypothetical protein
LLSFDADIKPLFREFDRREMDLWFDLWSHADVSEHAEGILLRLEDGTMPCDQPWSEEQLDTFRGWIEQGTPP